MFNNNEQMTSTSLSPKRSNIDLLNDNEKENNQND